MPVALEAQPPPIREALEDFVRRVREGWGERVIEVRLFGSRARGDAHAESDVDVLVVLDEASWRDRCRVIDTAADVGLDHLVEISPTVFDRETYERWRRQGRPLVADIEREGVAL